MDTRISWDEYFIIQAKIAALRSGCNSRPTGAVIVRQNRTICTGYNGPMPGESHCTDQGDSWCYRRHFGVSDVDKYNFCKSTHAEANAIAQAARFGIITEGASIYSTLAPCYVCTKLLSSAGIRRVYFEFEYKSASPQRDDHWKGALNFFEEWKQVKLSPAAIIQAMSNIQHITSIRKLEATE